MHKRLFPFFLFLTITISCSAAGFDLARFLPRRLNVAPESLFQLPAWPRTPETPTISREQFNQAVGLNNQGIDALNAGNFPQAVTLLSQAAQINPGELSIWKNLLTALKKSKADTARIIAVAKRIIDGDARDFHAYYAIGYALSDREKKYPEAIPFLHAARQRQPANPDVATALAMALEKGGYQDDARIVLEQALPTVKDDPYPAYLLGQIYLDQLQFDKAEQVLVRFLPFDREGYLYELLARCRFYFGKVQGLDQFCQETLRRFPQIINRAALERILFAVTPKRVHFTEKMFAAVREPEKVKKFHFRVIPPPTIQGKQQVALAEAVITGRGKTVAVPPTTEGDKWIFPCPPELIDAQVTLVLRYEINLQVCQGGWAIEGEDSRVDLPRLKDQSFLSLDDPRLRTLAEAVVQLPGEFLSNAYLAVGRGLEYKENFTLHPVSWALDNPRICDCTEYAGLLCSLYLTRGIPARVSTGFLLKPEDVNRETEIGHAWCQIFTGSQGWIPVDPTLGRSTYFSCFGNSLADQILFDNFHTPDRSQLSVDVVTTAAAVDIQLSSRYTYQL